MALTTLATVPPGTQAFYDRVLLRRAQPATVFDRYGQKRTLAQRSGNQIKFRRYGQLPPAATPLVEGVTPSGSTLATTDIIATLRQYGDYITLTDMIQMTNQDPVVTEAAEVLGDQAGTTIDQARRDVLVTGTNVAYAGLVASRNLVAAKITGADLERAIRFLKGQNTRFMREGLSASDKVGTGAVRKAFIAVVHPDVEFDLESIPGYRSVTDYGSMDGVMEDEIGAYKNIRFVSTTNAKIFPGAGAAGTTVLKNNGANYDVYATLIFGADAYAIIPLAGAGMMTEVKQLGSAGTADPLNQRSTVGWKATTTTAILNDFFMIRIETGASL